MSQKDVIMPLLLAEVDTGVIAIDTWTAFDDEGIEGACFFLRITNESNTDVFISYDGIYRHEYVAAGDKIEVNFQTNSSSPGYVSKVKKWTKLYVQGQPDQGGVIYLAGYYNDLM